MIDKLVLNLREGLSAGIGGLRPIVTNCGPGIRSVEEGRDTGFATQAVEALYNNVEIAEQDGRLAIAGILYGVGEYLRVGWAGMFDI